MTLIPTPKLFLASHSSDNILSFIEARDIGFAPQRVYYLKNTDKTTQRGFHAHTKLKQAFIATSGSFVVELEGYGNKYCFTLDDPNKVLYVPAGYYRVIKNFSKNAVCLVLASDEYNEEEYIRDYQKFKIWEKEIMKVMKVDYTHLDRELEFLEPQITIAFKKALQENQLILGPNVKKFEEEFAKYCGVKYAIGVANGLDALHLILKAMNIGSNDEVIIPSHTFIASALAVQSVGAKPVFIDVDIDTYNMDPSLIEEAITPNTKAIMPVHMHGLPCDMEKITLIAKKYNLKVIEDSAQAHGALVHKRKCGSFGQAAAFSLYPTKNLGCYGDGGIITTSDDLIAEKLYALRSYGSQIKYQHDLPGVNSRLDEIQAAALLVKLPYLDQWNKKRAEIASLYKSKLENLSQIILPLSSPGMTHIYHHFVIRLESKKGRDDLQKYLKTHGITTVIHYPTPLHLEKVFMQEGRLAKLRNSELFSDTALSLPISPFITHQEVEFVLHHIKQAL